ncbi:MAG TPA: class I SAM-dependent methyltransferase [Stellaceae bacterium]|nr:class I SAM-dependent methyltransferase [Stellaceae bacterium]
MERGEYGKLADVEDRMWWFRGLHANLIAAWRGAGGGRLLLDAGCGTGGLLARLAAEAPASLRCGIELDPDACRVARDKSNAAIAAASVDRLPFADRSFDAIFSADVLCHRGVDERAALAEFRRCLKERGALVLNLPAYRWLYSTHDAAVDNARRYARGEVVALLAEAGFADIRAGYWNCILFPLMVARRKLGSALGASGASDVALLPAPLERLFVACLALEGGLRSAGLRFPFGGSILAVAVRP